MALQALSMGHYSLTPNALLEDLSIAVPNKLHDNAIQYRQVHCRCNGGIDYPVLIIFR